MVEIDLTRKRQLPFLRITSIVRQENRPSRSERGPDWNPLGSRLYPFWSSIVEAQYRHADIESEHVKRFLKTDLELQRCVS